MRYIFTYSLLIFLIPIANAQVSNTGQIIHLEENSLLSINGNYSHTDGEISGNGLVEIKGNLTNNSGNGIFQTKSATTVLLSGNSQSINGNITTIPHLQLAGNGDKDLNTDLFIGNSLSLDSKLLHLGKNKLTILNPDADAIKRTSGFITTNEGGILTRNTNTTNSYSFPLGSTKNNPAFNLYNAIDVNPLYRPVYFTPQEGGSNTFSASLINSDPDFQYPRSKRNSDIENISDKYYYIIDHNAGSSKANIQFHQVKAVDNNISIVLWSNSKLQWEKTLTTVNEGDLGERLNRSLNFTSAPGISAQAISFAYVPFGFFNAFSPDGDGKNDSWQIKNIEMYPDNTLTIFNRWGDEVYKIKNYSNDHAWDGGNLQPGTYFYVLNVKVAGESKIFKGFITMIKKN